MNTFKLTLTEDIRMLLGHQNYQQKHSIVLKNLNYGLSKNVACRNAEERTFNYNTIDITQDN